MRRDSLFVLAARGVVSALGAWKALLLALAANLLLAYALAHPVNAALRQLLDRSPAGARADSPSGLWELHAELSRSRPDVLGDLAAWGEIATGERERGGGRRAPLSGFFAATGLAGSSVGFAVLAAALAALFAGGFAGRFGAEKDRGSLAAFGADAARFALPSLALGAFSLCAIAAAFRWIFAETGRLYEPEDLRYEWEAAGLVLLRLLAFLLAAAAIRLVVLYARAAMGRSGSANLAAALGTSVGFLLRRPARALALEILFGALGLAPLLLWAAVGPVWDGRETAALVLAVLGHQAVVFLRLLFRTAHLGAASAFLGRADEARAAAPARPLVSESEPAPAAASAP